MGVPELEYLQLLQTTQVNNKHYSISNGPDSPLNFLAAASCPMQDTSCMDDEESNVIYTVTTLDDAECASEYD